jgi:uncharacterized protein YeaO (DUF488 family)
MARVTTRRPPEARVSVRIKRVYEPAGDTHGLRVLVDRLWPRGLSKDAARVDLWLEDVAPSGELRHWFDHDPGKWDEFQWRYAAELRLTPGPLAQLRALSRRGQVTLVFASQERLYNNAHALQMLLSGRRRKQG